jgi:hypothetical protein
MKESAAVVPNDKEMVFWLLTFFCCSSLAPRGVERCSEVIFLQIASDSSHGVILEGGKGMDRRKRALSSGAPAGSMT